ncbi:MAG: hypothetical protein JSU95_09825 [Betaproteobacteria bacterium]|nr:MAG: hypothetical protein JSU95_09825 [Betaproteobacteria bacterium]
MTDFQVSSCGLSCGLLTSRVAACVAAVGLFASLAIVSVAAHAQAEERRDSRRYTFRFGTFDMTGVSSWFKNRFSEAELKTYRPEDFDIEQALCSCYDRPVPHYPYVLMLFSTPKGDLVGRPERRGFDTVIIPLAVRFGERYCEIDAEDQCYGSFANPCDFSDFRYGEELEPYFPGCLEVEADSQLEPVRFKINSTR